MIEAVLFDFGGTLFDYEPSNYSILAAVAREFGKTIKDTDPILSIAFQRQEEYIHELLLQKKEYSMRWMTDEDWRRGDDILLDTLNIHSKGAKLSLAERFHNRKMHDYSLFPDAHTTLEILQSRGLKLGILSNLPAKYVPDRYKMIEEHNLTPFFSTIVLSGERGVSKPNPKIFTIALEELGVSDPKKVIYVGDTYVFDVVGARNAGLIPILLDTNKGRNVDCYVIKCLSELVEMAKKS
jgi:putative hydrolase of the HAD superfamily